MQVYVRDIRAVRVGRRGKLADFERRRGGAHLVAQRLPAVSTTAITGSWLRTSSSAADCLWRASRASGRRSRYWPPDSQTSTWPRTAASPSCPPLDTLPREEVSAHRPCPLTSNLQLRTSTPNLNLEPRPRTSNLSTSNLQPRPRPRTSTSRPRPRPSNPEPRTSTRTRTRTRTRTPNPRTPSCDSVSPCS